ncbi:LytR/AlgR family response regulator transcription factor [Emticicia agri]|uniref:Response regulator transcription factor n=1 Tax=Emticicia agri TaxID=2492393 RepID=A0A4Q5M0K2_9BACT|nr:response regulator [Emticicia agri]RYU95535.1 response regulator transcription factor [Emticicia agri]
MTLLKILIIEDEIITATDLKEILRQNGHIVTAIAKNYSETLIALNKELPDLVLIDIQLRNSSLDGIEIAKILTSVYMIPFVFLTSHSETQMFERAKTTNPAAYLLKPIRHQEVVFQIELAYNHYIANKKVENNPVKSENVFLPLERGHQKIVKSDVLFIKAEGAYVNVYVKNQIAPFLFSMNIGYLAQYFLTSNFYQISRSYIVNLDYLIRYDAENIYVSGYNGKIPLPQNRKAEFLKKLAVIKTP